MRFHATHDCTILGEVVVGEDDLGNDLTEMQPVLEVRGRVDSGGTEFVLTATGERVRESPTIVLPLYGSDPETGNQVEVLDTVETGQDVEIPDEDDPYRIESVDTLRARGNRVGRVKLSVQKHT